LTSSQTVIHAQAGIHGRTLVIPADAGMFCSSVGFFVCKRDSTSSQSLTGFAVGRKSRELFDKALRASIELGFITAGFFALLYLLAGIWLVSLISPDPVIIELARQWLPWVVMAPLVEVWSFLLDGMFIGATQTAAMRNAMVISLVVFAVALQSLVPVLGNHGVWLSYHVLFVIRAVTLYHYRAVIYHRFLPTGHVNQ